MHFQATAKPFTCMSMRDCMCVCGCECACVCSCCLAMWTRIRLPHPHCPLSSHTPRTRLPVMCLPQLPRLHRPLPRPLLPHSHANLMQKYVKFSILNDAVAGAAAAFCVASVAAAFLCSADACAAAAVATAAVAVATGLARRNLWRLHVWIYLLVSHANAAKFQLVMLIKKKETFYSPHRGRGSASDATAWPRGRGVTTAGQPQNMATRRSTSTRSAFNWFLCATI